MQIHTANFSLASYAQGDPSANRLALVLPGFLDTKDHPHMRSHVDCLAGLGFYAVSFDPPGTWGSAGDISSYTMTNWLMAIQELMNHFGDRPTFVMGTSRGGTMAMLSAIHCPNVFACAAVMSKASYTAEAETIHPIAEWQRDGSRTFRVTIPGQPGHKQEFVVPYSVVEDTQQYNLFEDLHSLNKPKLFIEGLQDTTVRPEIVRAAYEYAAEPKQLASVDSDHLYRRRPEIVRQVNQIIEDFLV